MLTPITIPTTSTNLKSIAGDISAYTRNPDFGRHSVMLQNLGTTNIYFDFAIAATVEGGIRISPESSISYDTVYIDKINVISEGSDNTNIRLSIN